MKKAVFMFLVGAFSLLTASAPSLAKNPLHDAIKAQIAPLKRLLKIANAQHDHAEAARLRALIKEIRGIKASPSV